jgi:holin-like protein
MIRSMAVIFTCLALGEATSVLLSIPIPGSVIGMVLLTLALQIGIVKLEHVKPASEVLLRNLAFLFVPPGVGLMLYFDLFAREWIAILAAWSVSTFAVLALTGHIAQFIERRTR